MSEIKKLQSRVSQKEGLKKQAPHGQVEEIVGIACEELALDVDGKLYAAMVKNGQRRIKRKLALQKKSAG